MFFACGKFDDRPLENSESMSIYQTAKNSQEVQADQTLPIGRIGNPLHKSKL